MKANGEPMTTPEPSTLSEQEAKDIIETAISRCDVAGCDGMDRLCSSCTNLRVLERAYAQARAARPSPTCATCLHDANCEIQQAAGNYSNPAFGCTLHEAAPPAQDGGPNART